MSAKFMFRVLWFMVSGLGFQGSSLGCLVSVLLWFVVSAFVLKNEFVSLRFRFM